jgi:hypothetical protein
MKPNVFNLATKELSQDGFFTWLLQWADPSNNEYNKELCSCAQDFVKMLVSNQLELSSIYKTTAGRQWKNMHIDIWAEINDEILIIIEDKTFTGEHSNQLLKYKEAALDWCQKNNYKIVCIYLKVGTESLASLKRINEKGFTVISRPELIRFFKTYQNIRNDIFLDFTERIFELEKLENSFLTLPIRNWN